MENGGSDCTSSRVRTREGRLAAIHQEAWLILYSQRHRRAEETMFLVALGPATFKLLQSLIAPAKPKEKSYEDLVKVLTDRFQPTPSETMQCFKFLGRLCQPDELVVVYVAELSSIAEHSNFSISLQAILWDQFICRINDKGVQQRLLSESPLSFKKALSLTQGFKTAVQHVKELQVHKVASQPAFQNKRKPDKFKGRSTSACYRCGTSGHPAYQCKFKDVECYSCGKKGHYWAVCHSKPKPSGPSHSDIVASRQTISVASHHHCYSMA